MSVSKRIGIVLSETNLPSTKLGDLLNTSHSTVSRIKKGNAPNLSVNFLTPFIQIFPEISPYWLITGEGDKYLFENQHSEWFEEKGLKENLPKKFKDLIIELLSVNEALTEQLKVQSRILEDRLMA